MRTQNFESEKIIRAFRELKDVGYLTRRNWYSNTLSAWHNVPRSTDKLVFFNKFNGEILTSKTPIALRWRGNPIEICTILHKHGINAEWNGDIDTCIIMTNY